MTLAEALRITSQPQPDAPDRAIFLVSGFEPLQLKTFLSATARSNAPEARWTVESGAFGNWLENLERAASSIAETVLAVLEWSDLDPRLGARSAGGWTADILGEARRFLGSARGVLQQVSARKRTVVSGPVLPLLPVDTTAPEELGVLGAGLRLAVAEFRDWVALNTQAVVAGPEALDGELRLDTRRDLSLDLAAGHPLSTPCAAALAALLWRLAFPAPRRKGIITDLDNTLWKGILGEDGIDGIAWSLDRRAQVHAWYQQALASFAGSGVLVAVASRNDPKLTDTALRQPGLLIGYDRMFPVEAGWGLKSEAVGRILATWNIAAGSVIFVDDSIHEIEEVRSRYPDIECLQFECGDPARVMRLIERVRELCGKRNVTEEDRLRSASIRSGQQTASEARASDPEAFLAGLEARLTIGRVDARSFELVNKTNQFNLNGRRYSQAEWEKEVGRAGSVAFSVGYADRFGPLGQIGVVLARCEADALTVITWVLSCRAFSRRIEHCMMRFLFERTGWDRICFEFEPTGRNAPVSDLLRAVAGTDPSGPMSISRDDMTARLPRTYQQIEQSGELTYG